MEVGIVGLPSSGKTTVFSAVTRGRTQAAPRPDRPSLGVAKVEDRRLEALARVGGSKRAVPAEVTYLDLPASPEGFGKHSGIGGEMLTHIQRVDALAIVVRGFDDPSVPHVLDRVDAAGDAAAMLDELALVDMEIVERRLGRIGAGLKGARAPERANMEREKDLLGRLAAGLEGGLGVGDAEMSAEERKAVSGFGLLTAKPAVIVANLGESQIGAADGFVTRLIEGLPGGRMRATALFGQLEVDLASMDPAEDLEFRSELGIGESGMAKMVRACFEALDLITFFTVGPKETHAWAVRAGTDARTGAGAIHSDMERGFIRAEVAACDEFVEAGGEAGARREGRMRQEGKGYVLSDGDVVHVLFNV